MLTVLVTLIDCGILFKYHGMREEIVHNLIRLVSVFERSDLLDLSVGIFAYLYVRGTI